MPLRLAFVLALGIVLACRPATRTGRDIPTGWMEVAKDGWAMIVPADWETEPAWPYLSIAITRPSYWQRKAMMPTSPPPTFRPLNKTEPPVRMPDPYLTLGVSQQPRRDLDLDAATRWYARECFGCTPDIHRERRAVDVHGRRGTLIDIVRADGSREWTLVVQNDCHTYTARVRVISDEVSRWAQTVERVLASARVDGSGRLVGQCA